MIPMKASISIHAITAANTDIPTSQFSIRFFIFGPLPEKIYAAICIGAIKIFKIGTYAYRCLPGCGNLGNPR